MERKGIDYLKKKLENKRRRVKERYRFYEMKDDHVSAEITIPRHLRDHYKSVLGWNATAVDNLSNRLSFKGFRNDIFDIGNIFNQNNPEILTDSAILSALIGSVSFVYVSNDETGFPRLQVIDGANATGEIDPITGMLYEGLAVLERDSNDNIKAFAYFLPEATRYYKNGNLEREEWHLANGNPVLSYCALVPIINRPDAVRPFGHSVISRACMYWTDYAKRTLERSDITAEFYSWPQKYVLGTDPEAEMLDSWKATISTFLQFDKDEAGDHPVIGQFTTPSMSPFVEQLRMAASGFAGETGLTLDDLGFVSDNPSSAEAIKAAHESLRIKAKKAQRTFGIGLVNAGYIAACLRDGINYSRSILHETQARWEPVFTPDAGSLAAYGDAILKISQALPDYLDEEKIADLLGI